MTHTVSGTFADYHQVDSVVGALREASFEAGSFGVVGPDARPIVLASSASEKHGLGPWLMSHLVQRAPAHAQPEVEQYRGRIPDGRWMVTVAVGTDSEDRDARNLLVSAGAEAISSLADGTLVSVR